MHSLASGQRRSMDPDPANDMEERKRLSASRTTGRQAAWHSSGPGQAANETPPPGELTPCNRFNTLALLGFPQARTTSKCQEMDFQPGHLVFNFAKVRNGPKLGVEQDTGKPHQSLESPGGDLSSRSGVGPAAKRHSPLGGSSSMVKPHRLRSSSVSPVEKQH